MTKRTSSLLKSKSAGKLPFFFLLADREGLRGKGGGSDPSKTEDSIKSNDLFLAMGSGKRGEARRRGKRKDYEIPPFFYGGSVLEKKRNFSGKGSRGSPSFRESIKMVLHSAESRGPEKKAMWENGSSMTRESPMGSSRRRNRGREDPFSIL